MFARTFAKSSVRLFSIVFAAVCLTGLTARAGAQESVQVQPDVQNSRFQWTGVINSPDVYVRSGPGDAWYATQKLPQGTQVTIVGIKFDWLKIMPPAGSFGLVSKLYVDRRGDGTVGRVTRPDINVRAGSSMVATKSTVLSKLAAGDDVKILGEVDEYYKIAPPAGTYFYVSKQFVDPVRALTVNAAPTEATAAPATSAQAAATGATPTAEVASSVESAGNAPATQPAEAIVTDTPGTPAAPATQPVVEAAPLVSPEDAAAASFLAAETDFRAASQKSIEDQPALALAKRYEALAANAALGDTDRQTAGFRLAVLKVRLDAQARLAEVHRMEVEAAARDQTLKAEQQELQKRLDANEVRLYAAVGTLQPSSLQLGLPTLYRLVDSANGRTLIYVRGDDAQALKFVGKFVGVRGDAVTDDKLNVKVIPFTVMDAVDPAEVNGKVIAGIAPNSLLPHAVQASSTDNNN